VYVSVILFSCVLYGDSVDNSVEENSSVFSLIRMRWVTCMLAVKRWLICVC